MAKARKRKPSAIGSKPQVKASAKKGGKPKPTREIVAEQVREARESQNAKGAQASIRDRMVKIGRGNQQSGRQSGRKGS